MADPPRPRPSVAARLLGGGARGARAVAGATGIDDAVQLATEEAIVSALQSPAVERAFLRVLEGPATEDAVKRLLQSPAVERALVDVLDSRLVDKLVDQLLDSDEIQKVIERIAEAPEIRNALTSQGVGLLEDLGRQVRRIANRLDGVVESVARRIARKPTRTEPTGNAGLVTRGVGLVIDGAIINAAFFAITGLFAFAISALFPDFDTSDAPALVLGGLTFLAIMAGYLLFFWTLAGQTPGMRLLGIRLVDADGAPRLGAGTAIRRLFGVVLSILALGIGFLVVLVSDRRRGWMDRIANTEVILVDRDGRPESPALRATLEPKR
jgi:uncharacterized RDD family membrane protein YckC